MANTNMQKLLNATKSSIDAKDSTESTKVRATPAAAFNLGKTGKMPKSSQLMMVELDHDQVEIFKYHDRHISSIKSSKVEKMRQSIKDEGQIFPGIVRPTDKITEDGKKVYELIVGRLRFEGCRGITKFKAVIKDIPDSEAVKLMIKENEERTDITPYERWLSILPLIDDDVLSISEIARLNHMDRANLTKSLKAKVLFDKFNLFDCLDDVENVKLGKVLNLFELYSKNEKTVAEAITSLREDYPDVKNTAFLKAVEKKVLSKEERHVGKVSITGSKVSLKRVGDDVTLSFKGLPNEADLDIVIEEMRKHGCFNK